LRDEIGISWLVSFLKYVKGEKNVDEETTTGERYRVTDLGGSNVTL
jgi:hypothetical protein